VFRIGLHLGDVIVEGDDIYGDAVNVAVRLGVAIMECIAWSTQILS
jgi:class 3 adenylate cyclase